MLGLGRFLSSLRDMYKEVNPATLTGAVDVIVVEQENGSYVCSPFYVRFGKMGVLTSREKLVDITINEEPVNLHMRLNQLGDAYFIEDSNENREPVYPKPDWSTYNWADEKYAADAEQSLEIDKEIEAVTEQISEPLLTDSKLKGIFGDLSLYVSEEQAIKNIGFNEELFQSRQITFEQFDADPEIIFSSNAFIKWSGKCYKQNVAVPVLLSLLLYQRPLSDETINRLMEKYHEQVPSRTSPLLIDPILSDHPLNLCEPSPPSPISPSAPPMDPIQAKKLSAAATSSYNVSSWFSWRRGTSIGPPELKSVSKVEEEREAEQTASTPPQYSSSEYLHTPPLSEELNDYNDRDSISPNQMYDRGALSDSEIDRSYKRQASAKCKRTVHLNSDQLKKLNLIPGVANHATFSVTTKYQGTSICECDIYLWSWSDKIVISDVDGTITKSDVLGHILPIVGWQWEHLNVVELFGKIMDNGYKFVYLTARAIGQSHQTKDYLRSIRQYGKNLPEGPLLLSPTSLFMALHREVIEKKPEIFKIKCLREVKALFPESANAFYAGFGNKSTDEVSYRASGIPCNRIFTINAQGEVRLAAKDLKSSYQHILDLVDHIFPPLSNPSPRVRLKNTGEDVSLDDSQTDLKLNDSSENRWRTSGLRFTFPEEYSSYSYWRQLSDATEVDTNRFPPPEKPGRRASRRYTKSERNVK